MTDVLKTVLSVIVTVKERLPNLPIKNGQLIFVENSSKLAFDYHNKRIFYNQIELLKTEAERQTISNPIEGNFYFVTGTAILWTYTTKWIPLTTSPNEVLFIGTTFPEFGSELTLYVNKDEKNISVWDSETGTYDIIADKTESITDEEIEKLFT